MIKSRKPSKQMLACVAVIFLIVYAFFVFTKENEKRILKQNMEYIQDSTIQTAVRVIRGFEDKALANIPIIAMTALVAKPINVKNLLDVMENILV